MLKSRLAIAAVPVILGLALLAGCKQADTQDTAPAASETASDAAGGMELREAELVLPAVKGNPGAAYLTIANPSGGTRVISSIAIKGVGRTEVHQTAGTTMNKVDQVEIAPATTLSFDPGELHIMAFDVSAALAAGSTTEVTINFISGEKLTAPMKVISVSEAAMGDEHAGMEH